MITIKTRYKGATDTIGAKIVATAHGKTKSIPYPYELSGEAVHRKAAQAWVKHHLSRQGWGDTTRIKLCVYYSDKGGWSFEVKTH